MTPDEEFFHRALDRDAADAGGRFLLAEFCAERGDARAAGFRWLAESGTIPQDYQGTKTWDWNDDLHFDNLTGSIPHYLCAQLQGGRASMSGSFREYPTRRSAEEAFCLALLRHRRGEPEPEASE